MSEIINNREYRQKVLKELIMELHDGKSVDEVKARFAELIEGISAAEISEMEQALIREGMPVEEIQRLCDVHAAVFKGSIEEIHKAQNPAEIPGHPLHTFKLENRALEALIDGKILPRLERFRQDDSADNARLLAEAFDSLWEIDKHYSRKENLFFPYLEKYGITAPPKVMWGVDDEIREAIKTIRRALDSYSDGRDVIVERAQAVAQRVKEMIYKEENILIPMLVENLAEDEWIRIEAESREIGYALAEPQGKWQPARVDVEAKEQRRGEQALEDSYVKFSAGLLAPEEINAIFNTLPVDITYVDKEGAVKFFSQGKERIFARPKTIIGRQVSNCHPPASVHIVESIIADLRSGKKDHEDFWLRMGDKYVYIRYFAVRNDAGEFLGVMEVTQDIAPLQAISGEKDWLNKAINYESKSY